MMLKKMAKVVHFCGLDIGTHAVKASIIRARDAENLELLGVFETKATGLREASISDITELAESISRAVEGVVEKTGIKVNAVQLGLSADLLVARRSVAIIPLIDSGTKVIAKSDIVKVNHQARLLGAQLDEEIIHDFPQQYKVDDANVALNPIGLYGRKLETSLLLLVANAVRVRNLTKAVHQAGYEVNQVGFSSYAACEVAVDSKAKEEGCAVVDVGAHMTTVLFFKKGKLGDLQFIPWGGSYVTQSIAERLSLTIDMAEDIKKTHALAVKANPSESTGEILVKREKGYMPIRREAVCEAVNWEIENLLAHLEAVIKGSAMYHDLNKGVVMVGGASLLPGLIERIEERTNLPVAMGAATNGLNNAVVYAASIGLAQMHYLKRKDETLDIRQVKNIKDRIVNALKDVAQEYF